MKGYEQQILVEMGKLNGNVRNYQKPDVKTV